MVMSLGLAACAEGPRSNASESAELNAAQESHEPALPKGVEEHNEDVEGAESRPEDESEESGEHGEGREGSEHGEGRHAEGSEHREGGHDEGGEGEESGEYVGRDDTWDATRKGARLVLAFDLASKAFVGKVENTTRQKLCAVRVEVHLSTGTELGPTKRMDLQPGATTAVRLSTAGSVVDRWTAHPELSACSGR